MKILFTFFLIMLIAINTTDSIYSYLLNDIDGNEITLEKYKGNVLLIVNTASKCGYTPQYEGLQSLYEAYRGEGLVVLGFPANDFGGQEPGSDVEIKEFCSVNYSVGFPMFSKVSVKGNEQHPLFKALTNAENPDFMGEIKWNFEKFLIDKDGKVLHRFRSNVTPLDSTLVKAVEQALH